MNYFGHHNGHHTGQFRLAAPRGTRVSSAILAAAIVALLLVAGAMQAQSAPPRTTDTLRLDVLQRMAVQADPRAAQASLLERQSTLRRATITRELRPSPSFAANGQYLSDVPKMALPGAPPAGPLNHQYDAYASLRAPLVDPTRSRRDALEVARLAESEAALSGTLYQQRLQVNDAVFGILLREAQQRTTEAVLEDLTSRRRLAETRRAAGAALASDVQLLDAEIVRRRQTIDELRVDTRATRDILASLIGAPVADNSVIAEPIADSLVPAPGRDRPEYAQFARSRDVIDARSAVTQAQTKPRVALVGRTGYGRPGISGFDREFNGYWLAGVQVDWAPWNWGGTTREREEQQLATQIVSANEAQFSAALDRAARMERARLASLAQGLVADDTIVALREQVLRETRLRHDEGEVTTADYIARLTEAQTARIDRDTRRIRLAEARARYLTLIGREVR